MPRKCVPRKLTTLTLKTYMNSIAAVCNRTPGAVHNIVTSSTMWFPKFNDGFTACNTQHQKWVATKEAQKDPAELEALQDHERPQFLEATDMSSGIEAQRWFANVVDGVPTH